jgi:hypothetical protein
MISTFLLAVTLTSIVTTSFIATAADAPKTAEQDMKQAGRDLSKGVKKTARKIDDKSCEMVNGKMDCAGQKLKHGAQNVGDDIKGK